MWLTIVITVIAILLVVSVLLQARGSGLGASFGGDGAVYRTKRGIEKKLQTVTVILAVAFLGLAFANLFF